MSEINQTQNENEDVELSAEDLKKAAGGSSQAGQRFFSAESGQRFFDAQGGQIWYDAADAGAAKTDAADSAVLWNSSGGEDGSDRFSGS